MIRLNTIYPSFMGEVNKFGIGAPCTFVRLSGCNIRCYFKTMGILCDTPEALEIKNGKEVTVDYIVDEVKNLGNKVVCLTGGEPLLQDIGELLQALSLSGFHVVIETNGTRPIYPYRHIRNVSFVVDYKAKSSGYEDMMVSENYELLDENDFIKFVIYDNEDFYQARKFICTHKQLKCNFALGTFWGSKVTYKQLFLFLEDYRSDQIYINMQTHKMACLYDKFKDDPEFKNLFIPKEL